MRAKHAKAVRIACIHDGLQTAAKPLEANDGTTSHACLQRADHRRVTAAARLDIADTDMAILDPAGPSIGMDRGVFQD